LPARDQFIADREQHFEQLMLEPPSTRSFSFILIVGWIVAVVVGIVEAWAIMTH
jgi:hypothetical protein